MNNIAEVTSTELIEELKKRTLGMFLICTVPEDNTKAKSHSVMMGDIEILLRAAREVGKSYTLDPMLYTIITALCITLSTPHSKDIDNIIHMTCLAYKLSKGLK